jgi:hypothetical protein
MMIDIVPRAIKSLRPGAEYSVHVVGGETTIEWLDSDQSRPSEDEILAECERLDTRQVILDAIERLESEVTQRRIRDAYADSTWMDAQEAKIAVERAKL